MPRYTLIVTAQPVVAREAEWHRWYDDVHLDEVLSVSGFQSAVRLHSIDPVAELGRWMALYGIEADDDQAAHDALERLKVAPLTTSPAMDFDTVTFALFRNGAHRP